MLIKEPAADGALPPRMYYTRRQQTDSRFDRTNDIYRSAQYRPRLFLFKCMIITIMIREPFQTNTKKCGTDFCFLMFSIISSQTTTNNNDCNSKDGQGQLPALNARRHCCLLQNRKRFDRQNQFPSSLILSTLQNKTRSK